MYGIILIGKPCSGKSTIGRLLATYGDYRYISSGNIARDMAKNDRAIKDDLNAGKLAPEHRMRDAIKRCIDDCINDDARFILDGFPRFADQYHWLTRTFPEIKLILIEIRVSDDNALYRSMKRAREDSSSIKYRINYFNEYTKDLLEYCDITVDNDGHNLNLNKVTEMIYSEVMNRVNNSKI